MPAPFQAEIVAAIRARRVLRFVYHAVPRLVEPQACGLSTAGHVVLRGYQRGAGLRLYELSKISSLRTTDEEFPAAQPQHNPRDRAMTEIYAALPL